MAAEERESGREPAEGSGSESSGSSHPVGTGVGVVGGAAAGAVAGMAAGPLGMAVGGVAGAVVGGLAGRAVAEAINPADEEAFWRGRYTEEPYYEPGRSYEDYGPAYRYGLESRGKYNEDWDTAASRLETGWQGARGSSSLEWDRAQHASRAAWDRAGDAMRHAASGASSAVSDTPAGSRPIEGVGTSTASGRMGEGSSRDQSSEGVGAAVGQMQSAGDRSGDKEDVIDVINDLIECCKDGEYGFRACADHAKREDLRTTFQQRAEDCRQGCVELQQQVRILGGEVEDSGSALGAVHRGWVSVKGTLSTYDDKSILEDAERGEDNALARYRKALAKPLPSDVRQMVQRQCEGVQRNHDQIKMLRDQMRAAG